jgi:microcystin-dependent protein
MDPYLGQLMLVGFNFAPSQWAIAAGQLLPIAQYTALFSLLGTYYGGNGTSNFALPNLQGKVPIGFGQSSTGTFYDLGQESGTEGVSLDMSQIPTHTHSANADVTPTNVAAPAGNAFAKTANDLNVYSDKSDKVVQLNSAALTPFQGGNLPHNNMMPFLTLNWIIALNGIYPPRQ